MPGNCLAFEVVHTLRPARTTLWQGGRNDEKLYDNIWRLAVYRVLFRVKPFDSGACAVRVESQQQKT